MHKIEVKSHKNFPVDSNCYLLVDPKTKNVIVIDPGSQDCRNLLEEIEKFSNKVDYIILTHEHFDHIWGVNELKDKFGCKIVCSLECSNKIINRKKNLSVFYNQIGFDAYSADITFNSNSFIIRWGSRNIELLKTKGHSEGSICIKIDNLIFTGDTIIKNLKTVIKLPDSSLSDLKLSLDLIKSHCNLNTEIFPGHSDSFIYDKKMIDKCI